MVLPPGVFAQKEPIAPGPRYFELKARRRLLKKYLQPIMAYWRKLETPRPEGCFIKQYRIKEIKQELKDRPAFIPFERPFYREMKPDERVFQARDVFLSKPGALRCLEERQLADERREFAQSPSPLPLNPRRRLQEYLARRILKFWLEKDETALEKLLKAYDLREDLLNQDVDETPEEFELRRIRGKQKSANIEPLKGFRMRLFRTMMDLKTKDLIRRWCEQSRAFSLPRR